MVKKRVTEHRKPVIETIINSAALALTAFGVQQIVLGSQSFPRGYFALFSGVGLEYFKYLGRQRNLW